MSIPGGFVYKRVVIGPWADIDNTKERQALELMRIVDLFVTSGQGWTAPAVPTGYGAKSHFIVLTNETGSKVCLGFGVQPDKPTTSLKTSFFSGSIIYLEGFWFSYLPSAHLSAGFGSTLTSVDNFLPIDAMPIFSSSSYKYGDPYGSYSGKINAMSFGFKGDVFWMAVKNLHLSEINFGQFCVAGRVVDILENEGSNAFSRYAITGDSDSSVYFTPISRSSSKASFYREKDGAGSSRAVNYDSSAAQSKCFNCLTGSKIHSSTTSVRWGHVTLLLESTNLPVDGVANNDGVRGSIDPNIMKCCPETALTEGQLLDGGDMIHLFNGICVGWDPDNAPYEA